MIGYQEYFDYLQKRSFMGLAYRRCLLYPVICNNLDGRALDVGCGIGDMLRYRANTVGVDVNPISVAWCRDRGHDAHHMKGSALPFADRQFGSVLLDNVLEHIEQPMPLLAEVHRVLIDGGAFVVGVPGVRGYRSDPDHKVFYDRQRLLATIEAASFKCVKTFATPFESNWLNHRMRQYCIYGVFHNV